VGLLVAPLGLLLLATVAAVAAFRLSLVVFPTACACGELLLAACAVCGALPLRAKTREKVLSKQTPQRRPDEASKLRSAEADII